MTEITTPATAPPYSKFDLWSLTAHCRCGQCGQSTSHELCEAPKLTNSELRETPFRLTRSDQCPFCHANGFDIWELWKLAMYRMQAADLVLTVSIPEGRPSVALADARIRVACGQCHRPSVLLDLRAPASQLVAENACENCALPSRTTSASFEGIGARESSFRAVERFLPTTATLLANERLTVSLAL